MVRFVPQDAMLAGSARPAPAAELPTEYDDGGEQVERAPSPGKVKPQGARRFSEKYSDDGAPAAPAAKVRAHTSPDPALHHDVLR